MAQMYEIEEYTYHGSLARTNADTDRRQRSYWEKPSQLSQPRTQSEDYWKRNDSKDIQLHCEL